MASPFGQVPSTLLDKIKPFEFHVSNQQLSEFRELLRLSKIGPKTWWNERDPLSGVSREWLMKAKHVWLEDFNWRRQEDSINKFPNFKISIEDGETGQHTIHFLAIFSKRQDAMPVIFLHGWPGSFLEFLPTMELIVAKYSPENLPYHIIVPSLPDYGLSSRAILDTELTLEHAARIMNDLMIALDFGERGYIAQGGDIGTSLAAMMAHKYKECKAFHVNLLYILPGQTTPSSEAITAEEAQFQQRTQNWQATGMGYAIEQGTRPATIGLVLSSSPLSLLAWVGEKYLEWVDKNQPLELNTILTMVGFYWFTSTLPRSLYPYRNLGGNKTLPVSYDKPLGYSGFSHDTTILPKSWAHKLYPNLIFYNVHANGGHFAALERPDAFLGDVEEFIRLVGVTTWASSPRDL